MNSAALIPLFPLLGFLVIGLFGKQLKSERLIGIIGSGAILASFAIADVQSAPLPVYVAHLNVQRLG